MSLFVKTNDFFVIIVFLACSSVAHAGYLDGPNPAAGCSWGNEDEVCLKKAGAMQSDGDPV